MNVAELILPSLDEFRREMALHENAIEPIRGDLAALYRYVGLPDGNGCFMLDAVTRHLFQSIASALSYGHREVLAHFRALRREIIYSSVLDGTSLEADFSTLETIIDAIRPTQEDLKTPPTRDWKLALRKAMDYERLSPRSYRTEFSSFERRYRRDLEVVRAAHRLSQRKYELRRETGKIFLEKSDEDRIVERLQKIIASFPGVLVSRKLFSLLLNSFDSIQERYHYGRRTSTLGEGSRQIPINYLLQLCAKHSFGKKPYRGNEEAWKELIALSSDYAAIFDVQPYNSFELLFKATHSLLPFLQELALYDSLFPVPQMRPTDAMKICRGILGFLNPDERRGSGWTLNEIFAIGDSILSVTKGVRGSSWIKLSDIIGNCRGVNSEIIKFALKDVFSHPLSGANQRFNKLTDAPEDYLPRESRSGHDFFERPLLNYEKNNFFLLEKSFCAAALIESIFTLLRSTKITNFESLVGDEMERFLLEELKFHGINGAQGDYDDSTGAHGECDIVVECKDTVIFIEVKKQPLTRKARAGSDAALLVDMAASLLLAQIQAGWHEVRIRRDGFLLLKKDGKEKRVDLAGRTVERMAVTLFDYGSFQDRTLIHQFLSAQLPADYSVSDPHLKSKFLKINKQLEELRAQTTQLKSLIGDDAVRFFNCWFLSIPQFLVLLDGVSSPEDLKAALWNTRHVSMGTMDFYFEHAHMRKNRAASV